MPKTKKKDVDLRTLPRAERPAPTSGQSGTPLDLAWTELNKDEQRVMRSLLAAGDGVAVKINGLAKSARSLTTLKVRNALRRLVRSSLVSNVDRGLYKLTAKGKRRLPSDETAPAGASLGSRTSAAKVVRAPAVAVDLEDLKAKVQEQLPGVEPTDQRFSSGLIAAVASQVGLSDSKVAKAAGLSRGFVIPRVKRLKATGADHTTFLANIDNASKVAEGLSDSL